MHSELQIIWQEILSDMNSTVVLWQLLIITLSIAFSWVVNGGLKAYFKQYADENSKLVIGSINRILFPFTALAMIFCAEHLLVSKMHVGMLHLAVKLLLAMAIIRLMVYALRYIFSPSGWLKTLENMIVWLIWILLALHESGFLGQIADVLEAVKFSIGKGSVNLLMIIQACFTIVMALFVAMWLSRLIEMRLLQQSHVSMNMRVVMIKLIRIIFIVIATLIGLSVVGFDITLLSVFGGALGVGIGFGLQKIASNYVSGFIILLDESMKIGDLLTIESHYGVVTDLRSRYTVLRKLDGTQVIIPNETLITNSVVNHSYSDKNVRVQMPIQVSYQTDLKFALNLMKEIIQSHPRALKEPAPSVLISAFADSGIDIIMSVWIGDPEEGTMQLQTDIYLQVWEAFKKHGISIPFPQREVRLLQD
jgi:small-conductance mechanosensitive channel